MLFILCQLRLLCEKGFKDSRIRGFKGSSAGERSARQSLVLLVMDIFVGANLVFALAEFTLIAGCPARGMDNFVE
jgi:hypothetical protein